MKVLLILSSPEGHQDPNLRQEGQVIIQALERGRDTRDVEVESVLAATIDDLRHALLSEAYEIVHIASYGLPSGRLLLEDGSRGGRPVAIEPLVDLFRVISPRPTCVVLNACNSAEQAQHLSEVVPFAVGMEGKIDPADAVAFSSGFYDAIGAGWSVRDAFEVGAISANARHTTRLDGQDIRPRPRLFETQGERSTQTQPGITVHVEAQDGRSFELRVEGNPTIGWLADQARRRLDLLDRLKTGGYRPMDIRWIAVDSRAEDDLVKMTVEQLLRLRALVRTPAGLIRPSYSDADRLREIGVYDGVLFHLYAVQDFGLAGAPPVQATLGAFPMSALISASAGTHPLVPALPSEAEDAAHGPLPPLAPAPVPPKSSKVR